MARKGRMQSNLSVKPNELAQSREALSDAMARKGQMKSNKRSQKTAQQPRHLFRFFDKWANFSHLEANR